jgi:hypothetical protein
MIPLEQTEVFRSDRAMAVLIIALALTTRKLGSLVETLVPVFVLHLARTGPTRGLTFPRPARTGQVLTLPSCFAVATDTHRNEPDRAVLHGASLHLRRKLTWAHCARCTDLHTATEQERE